MLICRKDRTGQWDWSAQEDQIAKKVSFQQKTCKAKKRLNRPKDLNAKKTESLLERTVAQNKTESPLKKTDSHKSFNRSRDLFAKQNEPQEDRTAKQTEMLHNWYGRLIWSTIVEHFHVWDCECLDVVLVHGAEEATVLDLQSTFYEKQECFRPDNLPTAGKMSKRCDDLSSKYPCSKMSRRQKSSSSEHPYAKMSKKPRNSHSKHAYSKISKRRINSHCKRPYAAAKDWTNKNPSLQ